MQDIKTIDSVKELCVMVIDDDHVFSLMAKVLLNDTGITKNPISCTNGQEAINLLRQQATDDKTYLLFLDINMPIMNGWGVLDTLNELPSPNNIYVVIVTSSIDKADQEKAKTYKQLIGYLIKPIKRENLLTLKDSKTLAHFFQSQP